MSLHQHARFLCCIHESLFRFIRGYGAGLRMDNRLRRSFPHLPTHRPVFRHQDLSGTLQRGDVLDPPPGQNSNGGVEPSALEDGQC